jgi:hypothetical protein
MAMDVLEQFAGKQDFGIGLDRVEMKVVIFQGMRRGLVPEVGLEPT